MQIIVNGLLVHYNSVGEGRVVLVLHGWGDDSSNWQKFQKELSRTYKVITLDLPGFGASNAPKEAWKLEDYAKFLQAFLKKLAITNAYAIVGHSNGGAIAIKSLATQTLTADKLVLLGSAGIRGEYKGRHKMLRYITKAGKGLTAPLPTNIKKSLRQKVYKAVGSDMLVAEHMQETFKNIVEDDVREDAQKITTPTLLMYGEHDTDTPPRYGKIFQECIKGSGLEIIPDAGHFVYQDQPEVTEKLIKEFLL
jgi:pimeloyl-ACP methyl ester carboxylesterase